MTELTTIELQRALDSKDEELQKCDAHCSELNNTVSSLRRDVHMFKMRCDRAEETCSHEVERAVERVRKCYKGAETKRLKRPDGRIEDWVHDLVVELVALDGVPTLKVLQVIDRVWSSFTQKSHYKCGGDDNDKQTISDRSVRRIMVEAYVKAFLYSAKLFRASPCQCRDIYLIAGKLTSDGMKSLDSQWRWCIIQGGKLWLPFCDLPPCTFPAGC